MTDLAPELIERMVTLVHAVARSELDGTLPEARAIAKLLPDPDKAAIRFVVSHLSLGTILTDAIVDSLERDGFDAPYNAILLACYKAGKAAR